MNAKIFQNRILQHIAFWMLYVAYNGAKNLVFWEYFFDNVETILVAIPLIVVGVYLNLYILIPQLFKKKYYILYGLSLLGTIAFVPLVSIYSLKVYYVWQGILPPVEIFYSLRGYLIWSSETILLVAITTAIKTTKQWMQKERYARKLEKEKSEAEISFFKQQINPHFVFNALNSIYFAIPKSVELAQDIVMRLSEMLSHQLYDSTKDWIPLSKEVEYLQNYIEIERIRQGKALNLDCQLPEFLNNLRISPILLLPFVENAFKYAATANPSDYWVKIHLAVEGQQLHFQVENPYVESNQTTRHQKGGIGIANVKARLNMIYPKKHQLKISQEDQIWKVDLMMELSELENQTKEILTLS